MKSKIIDKNEIDIKKYTKGKQISKGAFGKVYQVNEISTGKLFAAKIIDCDNDLEQCNKTIDREIKIMVCTNHPTIVKFIGYSKHDFHDEYNITIIMEFAKNGSLANILKKIQENDGPKYYSNTTRQIIITGIASFDCFKDFCFGTENCFRKISIRYGAVILRNPKDHENSSSEKKNQKAIDQQKQRRKEKLIEHGELDEEKESFIDQIEASLDINKYPFDRNVPIQFMNDYETMCQELYKVECGGGGNDDQVDWASALEIAIEQLDWLDESHKLIAFVSNSNAYGKCFCGIDNHNEEEQKLNNVIRSLAKNSQCRMLGLNVLAHNDTEGCAKTLHKIKQIFIECGIHFFFREDAFINPIYDFLGDDCSKYDMETWGDVFYELVREFTLAKVKKI